MTRGWCCGLVAVATVATFLLSGCDPPRLHSRLAPAPSFPSPRTIELLLSTRALHLTPSPDADWRVPRLPPRGFPVPLDGCGPPLYGAGASEPSALPSARLASTHTKPGLPTVSLAVEFCRLARLYSFPEGRGRAWEEPAFVTFFDGDQATFGSAAGIRLHGNNSRWQNRKSYRFITRAIYGEATAPGEFIGLPQDTAIQEWVLREDVEEDQQNGRLFFATALAWDIARQIGALAPHGRTVSLRVNGENEGVYVLSERVEEGFLHRHLGPGQWEISRQTANRQVSPWLWRMTRPSRSGLPRRIPVSQLESEVDLDSLIRWHLAMVLCATAETGQATMARRHGEPWQWVNWDMNRSFRSVRPRGQPNWEIDSIQWVQNRRLSHRGLTMRLLSNLLSGSQEFRKRYVATANEVLDHRFTPDFVESRLEHYSALARMLAIEDQRFLGEIRLFLENRPAAIREHLARLLNDTPPATTTGNRAG